MVAIFVHGWLDWNGVWTLDKLRPYFEQAGYICHDFDRGFKLLHASARDAIRLATLTPNGAIGVGHSDGCLLLKMAANLGATFSQLVFINPALDNTADIGEQIERVHVWYAPNDWVLGIARLLPAHPWGNMGKVGYKGTDPRFRNHSLGNRGHLGVFREKNLRYIAPAILEALK